MNVFVTGGAGYIGSVCVEELLNAGHHVTVYDNLSEGHRAAVPIFFLFEKNQGKMGRRQRRHKLSIVSKHLSYIP